MSVSSAPTKHTIGNGTSFGWIGCPAILAVDLGRSSLMGDPLLSTDGGRSPRVAKRSRRARVPPPSIARDPAPRNLAREERLAWQNAGTGEHPHAPTRREPRRRPRRRRRVDPA